MYSSETARPGCLTWSGVLRRRVRLGSDPEAHRLPFDALEKRSAVRQRYVSCELTSTSTIGKGKSIEETLSRVASVEMERPPHRI